MNKFVVGKEDLFINEIEWEVNSKYSKVNYIE